MKHISRAILALFLAVLMAGLLPAQVFADTPDYISEIKIFAGDYSAAEKEGYALLKNGKTPVDLNQKAGGGWGSKGEKAVYLGYKTTGSRKEAITDLALMNMKGGYSVAEYEALMNTQIKSQILPFIQDFFVAIEEYRANYKSNNTENKTRALYFHDALNKLTDDDCGGQGLGDLLLNETRWEMGDDAYNKLSDEEKKNHVDLVTLLAQANGKATLQIEDLLTRAADSSSDSWLDRFAELTYADLIDATGKAPADAAKQVAKLYDDDANTILEMWEAFREQLLKADEAKEALEMLDVDAIREDSDVLNNFDFETATEEDADALIEASVNAETETDSITNRLNDYVAKEFLNTIPYGDGTMLDFFTQEYDEVADDITVLYPLVAALSPGQRAGLDYITLSTLVSIAGTTGDAYRDAEIDDMKTVSVYEGVDRAIYQKGGVALTTEALRKNPNALIQSPANDAFPFNWWTILTAGAALSSAIAFGISIGVKISSVKKIKALTAAQEALNKRMTDYNAMANKFSADASKLIGNNGFTANEYNRIFIKIQNGRAELQASITLEKRAMGEQLERLSARSSLCNKLMIGFGIAMIVLSAVTTYLAWEDMKAYYKVDFTPIPHYMIDEKDLIGYNKKGEKIILKNQSAYYKAVECNRTDSDEMYKTLGTCADMNGDVGRQWLALYAVKNELMEPILASTLTVEVFKKPEDVAVPAGYITGMHMFGSDAAFNLNSNLYDWNNDAPSVYVYFKTEGTAAGITGANFTFGSLALSGGAGILLGAGFTALAMKSNRKRNGRKTVTV